MVIRWELGIRGCGSEEMRERVNSISCLVALIPALILSSTSTLGGPWRRGCPVAGRAVLKQSYLGEATESGLFALCGRHDHIHIIQCEP